MSVVPHVVVLGGGYAGSMIAHELEDACRAGKISVTIVERRDAVHLKIGAIRASVRAGEWTERIRIPLSRVLKHGRNIIGDVIKVNSEEKNLIFADPSIPPLHYDILVAATGTLNHSPGDLPPSISGKDEVRAYYRSTAKAIAEAKDVTIVGGGASAVEFAGEIRDAYPDKPITIVCSSAHLLASSVAPLSPKFLKTLYKVLEERNIKLIREEKVVKPSDIDFCNQKFQRGPLTIKTVGGKCLELQTDLLVWAATWSVNTSIYPDYWLNELSELNIKSTFQLVEQDDVFAIGDVCSLAETKQAITLPTKMKTIKTNILKIASYMSSSKYDSAIPCKGLKQYRVSDKVVMYLPCGRNYGVTQIGKTVYGDLKTSKMKGLDLYTNLFWKLIANSKAPEVVDSGLMSVQSE